MEKRIVFGGIIGLSVLLVIVIILLLFQDYSTSTSQPSTNDVPQQKQATEKQKEADDAINPEETDKILKELGENEDGLKNFTFDDPAPESAPEPVPAPAKEEAPKE